MEKKVRLARGYKTSQVILASLAFASCTVFWGVYNSFIPLILDAKLNDLGTVALSATVISTLTGFIMTIDNIFGLIFQPMFGRKSDSTRSKWGKRMPYLIFGVPVCAILFVLMPQAAKVEGVPGILLLMLVVIIFNFVMSTWRAPCVAIMPDIVPPEYQSDGNAIVNMIAAAASLLAGLAATVLGAMGYKEAIASGDYTTVFIFGAILALALFGLAWLFVKWKDNRGETAKIEKKDVGEPKESFRNLNIDPAAKKSMIIMMVALFFISGGNDGFSTYFTLYATKLLEMDAATASLIKTVGMLGAVCLALPAGLLGRKIGRRKTILIGVCTIVATHIIMFIMPYVTKQPNVPIAILYFINWSGMILANINTLPIMLSIGGPKRFGAFTGYYYTATFTAAVVCPTVIGFLVGVTSSYNTANVFAGVCMLLAAVCVFNVKHGEAMSAEDEAKLQEAVREAERD